MPAQPPAVPAPAVEDVEMIVHDDDFAAERRRQPEDDVDLERRECRRPVRRAAGGGHRGVDDRQRAARRLVDTPVEPRRVVDQQRLQLVLQHTQSGMGRAGGWVGHRPRDAHAKHDARRTRMPPKPVPAPRRLARHGGAEPRADAVGTDDDPCTWRSHEGGW